MQLSMLLMPMTASAEEINIKLLAPLVGTDDTIKVDSKDAGGILKIYTGYIYRFAAGIVGIIAVLVIVISGIQLSTAGLDPNALESAKNRIMKSLAGLALLFLSGLLLYTINPNFFIIK